VKRARVRTIKMRPQPAVTHVQVGTMYLPKHVAYSFFGGFGIAILFALALF